MIRTGRAALLAACVLVFGATAAVAQTEPYEIRVPVASEGASEREEAFQEAMRRLLVRLTGSPEVAEEEESAAELIEKAPGLVQQFHYDRERPDESGGESEPYLVVRFDRQGLTSRIRDAELPQWSGETPATLVWLAVQSDEDREFLHPESHPELTETLTEAAAELGLRLIFPLLDFEDRDALRVSDVWGRFGREIRRASDRYDARSVLAGRLDRDRGEWHGAFVHYLDGAEDSWEAAAQDREDVAADAVTGLAERLREEFRSVPERGPRDETRLLVEEIRSLEDLQQVSRQLDDVNLITGLGVEGLSPNATLLRLEYRGDREGLESALGEAGLEPVDADATSDGKAELRYRLVR